MTQAPMTDAPETWPATGARLRFLRTDAPVDAIRVDVAAASMYSKSGTEAATVEYTIRYRKVLPDGFDAWVSAPYTPDTTIHTFTDKSAARVTRTVEFNVSQGRGVYELDIARITPVNIGSFEIVDAITVASVTEILFENLIYPHTALLGLRVLATAQLSGSMPTVSAVVDGLRVSVPVNYSGAGRTMTGPFTGALAATKQWTNNPVWCLYDLLTNRRYGLGKYIHIAESKLGLMLANFQLMAEYCDQRVYDDGTHADPSDVRYAESRPRFSLDVVLDQDKGAIEWLQTICTTMRASFYYSNGLVYLDIDRAKPVSQLFNMSSIAEFTQSSSSRKEVPNLYEVQFANAAQGYSQDLLLIEDLENQTDPNRQERRKTLSLTGVTGQRQATAIAKYALVAGKYTTKVVSFKTGTHALQASVGDVIGVQHDVPQWGDGGRVVQYDAPTKVLTLSEPIVFQAGKSYSIRLSCGGIATRDIGVVEVVDGQPHDQITLTDTPLDQGDPGTALVPASDDVYIIGETSHSVAPFKILNLTREGDGLMRVTAINYDQRIYAEADDITGTTVLPPEKYSELADPRVRVAVTNVVAVERTYLDELGSLRPGIEVYFTPPEQRLYWAGAVVVGQVPGSAVYVESPLSTSGFVRLEGLPKVGAALATSSDGTAADTYTITVVSVYHDGARESITEAQAAGNSTTIAYRGIPGDGPPKVRGLELYQQGNDTEFRHRDARFAWSRSAIEDTPVPDFGTETYGAGQGSVSGLFKDYKIEVWAGSKLCRTEYVTTNRYTYNYESNLADGNDAPSRHLTVKVWARDRYNRQSADPAVLAVSNPQFHAVANLQATPLQNRARLAWTEVNRVDLGAYKVWAAQSADFIPGDASLMYVGTDSTVVIDNLLGGTWYFKVAAIDTFGSDGIAYAAASCIVTNVPLDTEPPAVPVFADLLDWGNDLTFDPVSRAYSSALVAKWAANTEDDLLSYEVRYRPAGAVNNLYSTVQKGVNELRLNGLLANAQYVFSIRAWDVNGNPSDWSTPEVQITTQKDTVPPGNVTGLTQVIDSSGIVLRWNALADSDLLGYRVRRTTAPAATLVDEYMSTEYRLGFISAGSYTWEVHGVDTSGNYSAAAATTSLAVVAPGVVSGLTLTTYPGVRTCKLAWSAPSTGTYSIRHYEIRKGATFATAEVISTISAASAWIDEVTSGTYTYWVVAYDVAGNIGTGASQSGAVGTVLAAPGTPTITTGFVTNNSTSWIRASWSAVTGAPGYAVQIKKNGDADSLYTEYFTTETAYTFEGLTPGVTYVMRFRSLDQYNAASSWSSTISQLAPVSTTPPSGAPTVDSVTVGLKSVMLKLSGANTAADWKGYRVYVSTVSSSFTPAVGNRVYEGDGNLVVFEGVPGTTYFIKVSAFNTSGLDSSYTSTSATVALISSIDLKDSASGYNMVINSDFESGLDGWSLYNGTMPTVVTATNPKTGKFAAQNPAGVHSWFTSQKMIPIQRDRAFIVEGYFKTISGTAGTAYLIVQLLDASGANITGDGSNWYYPYLAQVPGAEFEFRFGVFGGSTSKTFPASAAYMRVGAILNYNIGSGNNRIMQVQGLRIREVIENVHILDASIQSAKIVSLTATKIDTGTINSAVITVGADGKLVIHGANQKITVSDATRERVVIGRLGLNDYGLQVYDAAGNAIFNASGEVVRVGKLLVGEIDGTLVTVKNIVAEKVKVGSSDVDAGNLVRSDLTVPVPTSVTIVIL
jgi:predicted phage tail protein